MPLIFFNLNESIEEVLVKVKNSLGIKFSFREGDSANVLNGIYYAYSIFGSEIKLEYNSYDYDDEFNYMLSIHEDVLSKIAVRDIQINEISNLVIYLLSNNLNIPIAYESQDDKLCLYDNTVYNIF